MDRLSQVAIGELLVVKPEGLSNDELAETLVAWHRMEAQLAAVRIRLTGSFDLRGGWRADGSKTAAAWISRRTGCAPQQARAQVRLARRLRHMALSRAAFEAGDITERHADLLAGLAGSPRKPVAEAFPDAEPQLVEHAKTLGFEAFASAARYWQSLVDEDGVEDQAAADHESRNLHLSQTFRGNYRIDGQLDLVGGTEVATELRRIERELFAQDWAAAKAVHGDDTRIEHLARTPAQRRVDALQVMARRSATAPSDGQPPRPLFVVHLGDDSLKRLCELAAATPVTPGQLVPLITEADIERIVYAGRSRRVIDLGRRSRFFTGPLRRAILLRDRHCQHPGGCDVPAEECEVDHITPWSKHGLTNQADGEAKCGSHNRHKSDTLPASPDGEAPSVKDTS